jgi:carbon-monoxide dehydrogenase medium subunit
MLPDELAVSARFPNPPPRAGSAWREVSRRHGDYAIAGVGALVALAEDDTVESARLAFISVCPMPVIVDVSGPLAGQAADRLDPAGVRALVDTAIAPESDIHASAEYRAHLARVLAGRALAEAAADARQRTAA